MIRMARFWTETTLAALNSGLCLLTLVRPAWIEALFGVDPDLGSGAAEWVLVVLFATASVTFGLLARVEWARKARSLDGLFLS